MTCNEARRMVNPFVNRELSDKEMEIFLDHIEHCSECKDELDIYFTVYRALNSLDSGAHHEFDFKKMLEEDLHAAKTGIFRRKVIRIVRFCFMIIVEALLLLSVFTGYELKKGEIQQSTFQKAIYRFYVRPAAKIPEIQRLDADD